MTSAYTRKRDWADNALATTLNTRDVSKYVSEIMRRVQEGETFTIVKHGKPIARITGLKDRK